MGRIEAGPIPINPHKPSETTYHPDGSSVTTHVELEEHESDIEVGEGHEAEAAHVTIALAREVPVESAEASNDSGVTYLGKFDPVVAAAHLEHGAAYDGALLDAMGADKNVASSVAQSILSERGHQRTAIAKLLAVEGSATGTKMAIVAQEADENLMLGRKVKITVSIIDRDGTEISLQKSGREKDNSVMVPGEWVTLRPKPKGEQAKLQRRKFAFVG